MNYLKKKTIVWFWISSIMALYGISMATGIFTSGFFKAFSIIYYLPLEYVRSFILSYLFFGAFFSILSMLKNKEMQVRLWSIIFLALFVLPLFLILTLSDKLG